MNPMLTDSAKCVRVQAETASAGTAVNTASVDMQGYDSIALLCTINTANAGNSVHAADSADNSTFGDLASSKVTPGSDNLMTVIDIHRPRNRYVRLEFTRSGADTALGTVYAVLYNGRKGPITGATIKSLVSPAQGTA